MERVGEHPVPAGPLAVRWLGYELPDFRAGAESAVEVVLQNAGTATWRLARRARRAGSPTTGSTTAATRSSGTARASTSAARSRRATRSRWTLRVRAPQPPGRYRLAFDLVEELRFWFAEVGSSPLELDAEVLPRIDERRLAVVVRGGDDPETTAALAAQEEPLVEDDAVATAHLVAGAIPEPDWSRRILDAHAEGFAAVGGSIEIPASARCGRGRPAAAATRAFSHPLLLPSLLDRPRAGRARGPPGLRPGRRAGDLRRPDQTSTAMRSSTRVKTNAPSASETTAATTR